MILAAPHITTNPAETAPAWLIMLAIIVVAGGVLAIILGGRR